MKKRLMVGLMAGGLMAAMLPGVASAQGQVELALICQWPEQYTQQEDSKPSFLPRAVVKTEGGRTWGRIMALVHGPDTPCDTPAP